jgi:hypothetical protein
MGLNEGRTRPGSRWRIPGRWILNSQPRPGSRGEHILQERYGTRERASQFYDNQFSDQLTPKMIEFIGRMEMAFIATSDAAGECDCSFRAGTAGFPPRRSSSITATGSGSPHHRDTDGSAKIARNRGASAGRPGRSLTRRPASVGRARAWAGLPSAAISDSVRPPS